MGQVSHLESNSHEEAYAKKLREHKVLSSIFPLYYKTKNNEVLSAGSSTFVTSNAESSKAYFLSAAHNLRGSRTTHYIDFHGEKKKIKILSKHVESDFFLFEVQLNKEDEAMLRSLNIKLADQIKTKNTYYLSGHRTDTQSKEIKVVAGAETHQNGKFLLHGEALSGMSGGGVFSSDGESLHGIIQNAATLKNSNFIIGLSFAEILRKLESEWFPPQDFLNSLEKKKESKSSSEE